MKTFFTMAALSLFVAQAAIAQTPQWKVQPDKSRIEWTATYGGKPITGSFNNFESDVAFDPEHLENSHVTVKIDTAKVTSEDKDAEQALPGAEWFDATKFPQAVFEAATFRHIAEERYEADGMLTIAEKKNPLTLPFTLHVYEDKESNPAVTFAQMTAEITLKRLAYGLGKGEWASTAQVADDVKVTVNLKAEKIHAAVPKP